MHVNLCNRQGFIPGTNTRNPFIYTSYTMDCVARNGISTSKFGTKSM